MTSKMICINCPKGCELTIIQEAGKEPVVSGQGCKRGSEYALKEITHPERILTTTIPRRDGVLIAVRTEQAIPKELSLPAMQEIQRLSLGTEVSYGDVIIENILGTGKNVIVTRV